MTNDHSIAASTGFLLSKIGQTTTNLFAEKLAPLGLRPKHCGLLAAVAGLPSASQQDLGSAMSLVPSAIVSIIDDLETARAIRRTQDVVDRRRHSIELTEKGRSLLKRVSKLAHEVDDQVLASLSAAERAALHSILVRVALDAGILQGDQQG